MVLVQDRSRFRRAHALSSPLYSALPNLGPSKTQFWKATKSCSALPGHISQHVRLTQGLRALISIPNVTSNKQKGKLPAQTGR